MKLTLIVFAFSLITSAAFAGEGWNKTKAGVEKGAHNVERETQKTIDKGKQKMEERKEHKSMKHKKEKEEQRERKEKHQHKYE